MIHYSCASGVKEFSPTERYRKLKFDVSEICLNCFFSVRREYWNMKESLSLRVLGDFS